MLVPNVLFVRTFILWGPQTPAKFCQDKRSLFILLFYSCFIDLMDLELLGDGPRVVDDVWRLQSVRTSSRRLREAQNINSTETL